MNLSYNAYKGTINTDIISKFNLGGEIVTTPTKEQ